jgi:hypothetical protein
MKFYYYSFLFLIVIFLVGCASKYNNLILGNWKRHTLPASDTLGAFDNSGWGDITFKEDYTYQVQVDSIDGSKQVSVEGWSAAEARNGLWKIKDKFLELSMYEREGIPVYLRYEIIKLNKDSLMLRSVIGGYDPEDYMIYAKQP